MLGTSDGVPKTPEWAAEICGIAPHEIVELAARMAENKTFITVMPSLQRAEFGEQPIWMGITLAAMLGGIGLPGQGFGCGFGAMALVGNQHKRLRLPSLPQGQNGVSDFIPVARIADMLLGPGEEFFYNGQRMQYPDIRLVYWAGGNPFHHHQDLFRLSEAYQRPETLIVHEPFWTGTARHADIVLPATMTVERNDFGASNNDPYIIAMKQVIEPYEMARDDFDIFASVAQHLGVEQQFTEGRTTLEWIEMFYEQWRGEAEKFRSDVPSFEEFWRVGHAPASLSAEPYSWLQEFRADPVEHALPTPSGRIELDSRVIAGFQYDDCPSHPSWLEPREWLGGARATEFPFALISNQPRGKLHSQFDMGSTSEATRSGGREKVTMNPDDAERIGVRDGDLVQVASARGGFLAVVSLSESIRRNVVQTATGAWFDPDWDARLCVHGNPNAATQDVGTSKLAQGPTGQLCLVDVKPWRGAVPEMQCFEPPAGVMGRSEG